MAPYSMKWSNWYTVFDVENVLRYTLFGVMFPTTFSITALNIASDLTIGGYMNFFFKQAKDSIVLIFSSKLQDIFARGRQGVWSVHPTASGGMFCKFNLQIQSVPACIESWYVI